MSMDAIPPPPPPPPPQSYFFNDDVFNFNYAQAKAATGNFQEAEEIFLLINSDKIKNDYVYLSWLARCCEFPYHLSNSGLTPLKF